MISVVKMSGGILTIIVSILTQNFTWIKTDTNALLVLKYDQAIKLFSIRDECTKRAPCVPAKYDLENTHTIL